MNTDLSPRSLPQLEEYAKEREKGSFIKGILLMTAAALFTAAAFFFSSYPIVSLALGVIAEIYIFLKFCLPRITVILDKPYYGRITGIKKKTVSGGKAEDAGDVPSRFRVKLKTLDTEGKKHTYTFYNEEADNIKNYFAVGDSIYHYKGILCPEKVSDTFENGRICLLCTRITDKRNEVCPFCETPLPDNGGEKD